MFFKKSKKITVKPDLSNVDKVLNTNLKFYLAEIENINRNNDKVFSEVDSLKEMFLEQNNRITSQEDELSKYRKGYDNLILKNFYEELIDLHELIEEYEVTKEDNNLKKLKSL